MTKVRALHEVVMGAAKEHIEGVLSYTRGRHAVASTILEIGKKELWEKMKAYGIEHETFMKAPQNGRANYLLPSSIKSLDDRVYEVETKTILEELFENEGNFANTARALEMGLEDLARKVRPVFLNRSMVRNVNSLAEVVKETEMRCIHWELIEHAGDRSKVARALKMPYGDLLDKAEKYGLNKIDYHALGLGGSFGDDH